MTAPRRRRKAQTVTAEQSGRTGVIYGPVAAVHAHIRSVTDAWEYDPLRHAYVVPLHVFDAVLIAIESAGHRVQIKTAGWV